MLPFTYLFGKFGALKSEEYGELFSKILSPYQYMDGNLLEIGLGFGGSMNAYRQFFPNMTFYSIEIAPKVKLGGVKLFQGDQSNTDFLREVVKEVKTFTIIIDDGGHWSHHQQPSMEVLLPSLSADGIYIIEDLQVAIQRCTTSPNTIDYITHLLYKHKFYPTQRGHHDLCTLKKN